MYKGKIIDIEIDDEHIYGEVIGETKETISVDMDGFTRTIWKKDLPEE